MRAVRSAIPNQPGNQGQIPFGYNRKSGRLAIEGVGCNRGKLLDLSKNGCQLQVKRPWARNESRLIVLTGKKVQISVTGVCRRVEKLGFRKYALGIQFIDCDDTVSKALMEIVRSHCTFLDEPDVMLKKRA